MKSKVPYILLLLCSVLFLIAARPRPIHIFMAGDSTMANKPLTKTIKDTISGEERTDNFQERGWGQLLPQYFTEKVIIDNRAMNGRSTRTFIEEGRWAKIVDDVQKGDFVVVQFGHNDSSFMKKDRYTPPEDYKKNLQRFVDDVRKKGATPILCTSVARRKFDKEGRFIDSHGIYLDITRSVAAENKVPMVDMYQGSKKLLVELGDEKSAELFMHIKAGENKLYPNGLTDNTHFKEQGAEQMAKLFVQGIKDLKIKPLTQKLHNKSK